ncbi:MAG: RagB/SusD family nutrient uptake outer membrane protein [Rikenellaceae bacterium]
MKAKFKYILEAALLSWVVISFSCSDLTIGDAFLEKAEGDDTTIDSVFSKSVYAEQALATAYSLIPFGIPMNNSYSEDRFVGCPSDLLTDHAAYSAAPTHGPGPMYNGTYSAYVQQVNDGNTICPFTDLDAGPWYAIRQAYIVAENMYKVSDLSETEQKRWAAEAKVLVAHNYIDAFRHYGSIPWLSGSVSVNDDFTFPRPTVEEFVDNVVALLDEAIEDLAWTVTSEALYGHMTKASAVALKIRVLLFAASPLFNDDEAYMSGDAATDLNTWYGDYSSERWQRVIEACEQFESLNGDLAGNSGTYKLVEASSSEPTNLEYQQAFQDGYYTRSNGEILVPSLGSYQMNSSISAAYLYQTHNWGRWCPVANYVQKFGMADGTPFDWENATHAADPFYTDTSGEEPTRDPRLYQTIVVNGSPYKSRTAQMYIGGTDRASTTHTNSSNPAYFGLRLYKFLLDETSVQGKVIVWPEMRLPEVLLSYAEALVETGNYVKAYDYINTVRRRVGLCDVSSSNIFDISKTVIVDEANPITTNGNNIHFKLESFTDEYEALIHLILNERSCEFGYENVRWFDIKRRKLQEVFETESRALDITLSNGVYTYDTEWVADGTIKPTWRTSFSSKWYLQAFPTSEVNKDYGLTQNPGWE